MNDSTNIANDATALQNQSLFKDQTYTDAQPMQKAKLRKNCTSETHGGNPDIPQVKQYDNEPKEFNFEKSTISKKSSRIKNLGEFYEIQKSKTSQVMRKLQLEAQRKMPLFHSSIGRWTKVTEKLALGITVLATAAFIIIFVMMIYYLCGVSDGNIAWWVGVELLTAVGMLIIYFRTTSLLDNPEAVNYRIYIIVCVSVMVGMLISLVAIYALYSMADMWKIIRYAFVYTINKSEKRKGVLSLFVTYSMVSSIIKQFLLLCLIYSVHQFRKYKRLLYDEERIANTSKPEYHI
jgi:hypothetical protein